MTEKVALEYYLPDLKQTPDLLVNDKIAIEIQCSTLSLERLIERTENYRKHGFYVIWLMGKNLWLKKTAPTLQENLVYFSENRGFYYWELDEGRKKIRLKSLIHQDIKGQLYFKMEEYDLFSGDLLALLRLPANAGAKDANYHTTEFYKLEKLAIEFCAATTDASVEEVACLAVSLLRKPTNNHGF